MSIKRTLFLLILFLSINLTAQHKPFQFGFKAGPNIGWFTTNAEDFKNHGADFGGSWGFIADIYIMENYSFTTGFDVLYLNGTMSYPTVYENNDNSTAGWQKKGNLKRSYRTKYIKLPFIFTMKTNKIKKLRYFGQIGFGLNILLTAKGNDEFTPDDGSDMLEDNSNIYNDLRATRESLILGAGVEIPIQGSTYVRVGLVYDNAFINILKGNNSVNTDVRNNGKNSFLELEVSILF